MKLHPGLRVGLLALGASVASLVPGCACDDGLTPLPGAIDGWVCEGVSGQAVETGDVEVTATKVLADGTLGEASSAIADDQGAFLIDELTPGNYELSSTVWSTARVEELAVSSGNVTDFADAGCRPPPGPPPPPPPPPPPVVTTGGIQACMCDASGEAPLAGATVTLTGGDGLAFPVTADGEGCFSAEEIPTGTWQVTISPADGSAAIEVEVEIAEDQVATLPSPPRCERCVLPSEIAPGAFTAPTDIIWMVDNSSSMDWEENTVQSELNGWSDRIANSGVDARVVMVASASNISVPPPLGGSPAFLAVDESVGSTDALERFLARWADIAPFLREGSVKHLIVVSDDDSDLSASDFLTAVAGLELSPGAGPAFGTAGEDWFFHSIVGEGDVTYFGCLGAAKEGTEYISLSNTTQGVLQPICQQDWDPIFDALETAVLETAVGCAATLPSGTADYDIDLDAISLTLETADGALGLTQVAGDADCPAQGGWFLSEDQIVACPTSCELSIAASAPIDVEVGCVWVE